MAAQLAAAGKVVLFEGLKEMLLPYLDVAPLMPPERLRWSRLLRRPLMEQAGQSIIAAVSAEEMRPYPDCDVLWHHKDEDFVGVESGTADELPADAFWVYMLSEGDEGFADEWRAKHGHPWPFVEHRQAHKALAHLRRRYMRSWADWTDHGGAIMEAFHDEYAAPTTRFLLPQAQDAQ